MLGRGANLWVVAGAIIGARRRRTSMGESCKVTLSSAGARDASAVLPPDDVVACAVKIDLELFREPWGADTLLNDRTPHFVDNARIPLGSNDSSRLRSPSVERKVTH